MKRTLRLLTLTILILVGLPAVCPAHTVWINATDYSPSFYDKFGARTKAYFGYGHRYPVDDFLPAGHLTDFVMFGPNDERTLLDFENASGFLETTLHFKQPGQYIVAASLKPGFYTMYMENNDIRHKIGPKTGLEGVILSNYYEQYAKSLINVGSADGETFLKSVGHRLEIVPQTNPQILKGNGGDVLSIRVLFNGEPAKFCRVYATYAGFSSNDDFACATMTDGEGIAHIRLTHWGAWLIKANLKLAPTGEMQDRCNDMNYTATLTLEIP